jgi:hypothetical protein
MMKVTEAINLLNGTVSNDLTGVQRVMLMHGIQDAARRGDKSAAEFIELCAHNVTTATKH